jgi:hypothetical protein
MQRLSFSEFLKEGTSTVYFTFGRMNPPTIGHEKLIDAIAEKANHNPYRVYLSHSNDKKKNPLLHEDKIKIARKAFPRHGRSIRNAPNVRNILEAATACYEDGFKNIVMVCGKDRLVEFKERLSLYNDKAGTHGFYKFESIKVVSGGDRDPDSDGAEGASATRLREAASQSDFAAFSQGLPKSMSTDDSRHVFNKVRVGLGLTEEKTFRNHVKLGKTSDIREQYIQGNLFEIGEAVVIIETQEVATLAVLGANYVIVETADGRRLRKWLDDVETLN